MGVLKPERVSNSLKGKPLKGKLYFIYFYMVNRKEVTEFSVTSFFID